MQKWFITAEDNQQRIISQHLNAISSRQQQISHPWMISETSHNLYPPHPSHLGFGLKRPGAELPRKLHSRVRVM